MNGHISRATTASAIALESFINSKVPVLAETIDHENLEADCFKLIQKVFPSWDLRSISIEACKNGITNKLMRCTNDETGERVLVRTYGKCTERLINRLSELMNFVTLSKLGLCPPLYARFRNGFIYGYAEGSPFSIDDMSDAHRSRLVARKLAHWHKVHIPGDQEPALFSTLRKWYEQIDLHQVFQKCQQLHRKATNLLDRLNWLEKRIADRLEPSIVFCHNDLLMGNIIYNEMNDSISFIDFEYAGRNYQAFDIANYFCEFAGFEGDYGRFPDEQFQRAWISHYLAEYLAPQRAPTEAECASLLREVAYFVLASHLFWSIWSLVQATQSDLPFDYFGYAQKRLDQLDLDLARLTAEEQQS